MAKSILNLEPQPEVCIFCENNSTDNSLKLLSEFNAKKEILRLWFRQDAPELLGGFGVIALIRQFLLQRARQLDPDYALFLDADIVVRSADLLERLTGRKELDIVGGVYTSAYPDYLNLDAVRLTAFGPCGLSIFELSKGPVLEVDGMGGGCMCIGRRVVQDTRLNFYPIQDEAARSRDLRVMYQTTLSEDLGYCLNARQLGYRVGLEMSVKLSHLGSFEFVRRAWRRDDAGLPSSPVSYWNCLGMESAGFQGRLGLCRPGSTGVS